MAITLKKGKSKETAVEQPTAQTQANAPEPVAEVPATELQYLPEDIREQVAALPEGVKGLFVSANELTPQLIETAMPDMPETLTEALLGLLEAAQNEALPDARPAQAQEVMAQNPAAVTDEAARQAKRDALKQQIAAGAQTPIPAKNVKQPADPGKDVTPKAAPAVEPAATLPGVWDQLFPVGQAVTVINRGSGRFEVHVGAVKALPAEAAQASEEKPGKKAKKPSVKTIFNDIQTDEYREYLVNLKENYPTLDDRIAWATELGLVRGKDWVNVTKAGLPMPPSVENMYLSEAIRNKLGIETYIEGARTKEERKKIATGELPMPSRS